MGKVQKLDVLLYGNGGETNTARRIGLLLHEFCEQLSFIVPHHCQSACTLLALTGKEIIAGDLALFSPVDPGLTSTSDTPSGSPGTLASEDVRLFCDMAEQWFGVSDQASKHQLLEALMHSVFPTTLTSLYRSTEEQRQIAEELLAFHQPDNQDFPKAQVIEQLMHGYHSHHYSLTGNDLAALGLNITRNQEVELIAWRIASKLGANIGSRAMQSIDEPLNDMLIASKESTFIRQKHPHVPAPSWQNIK